ncbi:MAG: hypothetical protein ACXV3S_01420, partial [Kineosporiaceae bacterium]
GWTRALWLLLVPFMLVNVAVFMTPFPFRDGDDEDPERSRRRSAEAATRVLALALTGTLVLAACGIFLDLLAWQCGYSAGRCTSTPPLGILVVEGLRTPSQRLALGALAVLAVVGLLAWLGRSTWTANERLEPRNEVPATRAAWRTPLESRDFWRGGVPVQRLRRLHVGAALAVVGILTVAPLLTAGPGGLVRPAGGGGAGGGGAGWLVTLVVDGGLLVVALCLVAALQPSLTERLGPREGSGQRVDTARVRELWLLVCGGAVAAAANALAWLAPALGIAQPSRGYPTILPWFTGASTVTFLVEALAIIVLAVAVAASRFRWQRDRDMPWWGFGSVGLSVLGWALAGGFAVALHLWVAGGLGSPANDVTIDGDEPHRLLVPLLYFWGGAALVCALAATVVAGAVALLLADRDRKAMLVGGRRRPRAVDLVAMYPNDLSVLPLSRDAERREKQIAWQIALGRATPTAIRVLGWLLTVASVIVVAAAVLDLTTGTWIVTSGSWLSGAGSWVLAFAAAGFFTLAYKAYDTPTLRRTVGILWDLGTFWPRATHPLAPPCYSERAVPELLDRIHFLLGPSVPASTTAGVTRAGMQPRASRVVLSCHSQGSVIGAAVVAANTFGDLSGVAFLTYGCPLRRLYSRFFPAYLGPTSLDRLGQLLQGGGDADGPPGPWPWINLYRLSDPIGGFVFRHVPVVHPPMPLHRDGLGADAVDLQLLDPAFDRPDGDPAYPIASGHSEYWLDPTFAAAAAALEAWAPDKATSPAGEEPKALQAMAQAPQLLNGEPP